MNLISNAWRRLRGQSSSDNGLLRSCQCTQAQLQSDTFQEWARQMHERPKGMHRKIWEFAYIAQALYERGKLAPGQRGLGFAVGQEPLPALFASLGCEVVATDLATEEAHGGGWVDTAQHADSLGALNQRGICAPEQFERLVSFRFVDMRKLPPAHDLGMFDFIWSSCSLEHLGSMALGEKFIDESLRYLKPGGHAVHTTEFNVKSNRDTVTEGQTTIFRKKDIQRIAADLRQRGCRVDLDFTEGNLPHDLYVDPPPYKQEVHLRLLLLDYIVTSYALIIDN